MAGQITALKFYRSSGDTGSDLLDLWTSTGTKLGQRDLHQHRRERLADRHPGDARHDRRQHDLCRVVPHDRRLCGDQQLLHHGPHERPADRALLRLAAGGNGVYSYGGTSTTGIFPTNTFSAANYWADVVFASSAANTRADGCRRHRRCHRERRHCQRLGRLARHRQCADQRHRSRCRRHQDRHRGQLRRDDRHAWHGAHRCAWQPRAQCRRRLHLHRQRDGCRRAGLAAIDQYADRCLQLHHARHGRRDIVDHAHGHHSRRQRCTGACGSDRQPECGRRLGLLADPARRHLRRRRFRRHAHLQRNRRRRLTASLVADVQRLRHEHSAARRQLQTSARSASRLRSPTSAASPPARPSISP